MMIYLNDQKLYPGTCVFSSPEHYSSIKHVIILEWELHTSTRQDNKQGTT